MVAAEFMYMTYNTWMYVVINDESYRFYFKTMELVSSYDIEGSIDDPIQFLFDKIKPLVSESKFSDFEKTLYSKII